MGRAAAGVKGIELEEGDEVVGVASVPMEKDAEGDLVTRDPSIALLTITQNGYGKRTAIDEYRVQPEDGKARSQSRGGKGRADIKTSERNGRSVAAIAVRSGQDVVIVTKGGQLVRVPVDSISMIGRNTQGVRVVGVNEGDAVVSTTAVDAEPAVESGESTDSPPPEAQPGPDSNPPPAS